MRIRDYQSGDFPQIEAVWKDTGIYRAERGDSPSRIERCNALGGKFLVLEDPGSGKIVATSWLTWDGRRIFWHHFAVLTSLQNRGYGRLLANASMAYAREKGVPVKLEVETHNHSAVHLYRSLGFEPLGDYDVYLLNLRK